MELKIALAGNPNCGKTTLFNDLTGSSQYVGNWPGVTVEKKEGKLRGHSDVIVQDLPGIYSLSPYTLEEVVSRKYLVGEKPDAILNIVDGTNIERNLYLTTQLIELGIPVLVAVNMMDLVRKNGDKLNLTKLSERLGCPVVEMSALKSEGCMQAAEAALALAEGKNQVKEQPHVFTGSVEHAIAHIEESIQGHVEPRFLRWYAIKLFERDSKVQEELNLPADLMAHLEQHIADCEAELDDDAESIVTNQRYAYINKVMDGTIQKAAAAHSMSTSDKIDSIVTNRILALPIFALVMWLVYYISVTTVGTIGTDWANDGVFGDGWHLFGIGTSAYEEAAEPYGDAMNVINAFVEADGDEALAAAIDSESEDYDGAAAVAAVNEFAAAVAPDATADYTLEDDETLGRIYVEDMEAIDVPEHLLNYFDYEAYGRDIRINDDGHYANGGYMFNNGSQFIEHYTGRDDIPDEYRVFSMPKLNIREQMAAYKEVADRAAPEKDHLSPKKEVPER